MKWLAIALGLLLGSLGFWLVDMYCGQKQEVVGTVVGHTYIPAFTSYITDAQGNLIPTIQPAQYHLSIDGPHGRVDILTEPFQYMTEEGEQVTYTESRGFLTGHLYSI